MNHRRDYPRSNPHVFLADGVFDKVHPSFERLFGHLFPNFVHGLNPTKLPIVDNQEIYMFDLEQEENLQVLEEARNSPSQNLREFRFEDL